MTRLVDGSGKQILLGREIARGGEGTIFEVAGDPSTVAKLYHPKADQGKSEKLLSMIKGANQRLLDFAAWPSRVLHREMGGAVVGFLMRKITGFREIHELYSPAHRKVYFPKVDWSFLVHVAMNCAAAIEAVHYDGHIVGDVNEKGILVNDNGLIRLIDCDSFQIRASGSIFRCVVGVPQYTPPELQGKAFRGVERTANHDAFGLALLIFHLLFMGRHPFAGRFHGKGDMPVERAIAEGRFAFGKLASSLQMTAPPHSLPLDALPSPITEMFERAFGRSVTKSLRPTAAEWRQTMHELKGNLGVCGRDNGHRFPKGLPFCPWCNIESKGGPSFFITVQILKFGVSTLPRFDASTLLNLIESVPWPNASPPSAPRPSAGQIIAAPIPDEVKQRHFLSRLVRLSTLAGSTLLAIGFFGSQIAKYIGGVITLIFGIWWIYLAINAPLRQELKRRKVAAESLRRGVEQARAQWTNCLQDGRSRFEHTKNRLHELLEEGKRVDVNYQVERRQLEANRRQEQLLEYLDRIFIHDHRIDRIGPGRRATLLSYGVETAADADEHTLLSIPGFGPAIVGNLMAWRRRMEGKFVFDHTKPIPLEKFRALILKHRQLQQRCESSIHAGVQSLRECHESTMTELERRGREIIQLEMKAIKADADKNICMSVSRN